MNTVDYPPTRMNSLPTEPTSSRTFDHQPSMTRSCSIVTDGEVCLVDDAEEISLHMAHKVEDKLHSERKVRGERPPMKITTEAILDYLAQSRENDAQAKLEELASHILSGRAELRQAISQYSQSAPRQFLALQYVLQRGQQGGASEDLLAELSDALAELEQKHGPAIRAGLNTISAAAAYAHNTADIASFERTYHDVVLGEATLAQTLSVALSRFGGQRIAEGLTGLIQALGLDLAATHPSVSSERIHALLNDMHHLQIAVTILDGCHELAATLTPTVGKAINNDRLMQDVVGISGDKWISESRFSGLADEHGVQLIPDRIAFLSGVRSVLKDLPTQIYTDDEARTSVLDAAQDALDSAIDEELL